MKDLKFLSSRKGGRLSDHGAEEVSLEETDRQGRKPSVLVSLPS